MSKPRVPRLRASCDGCFIAKVKCSKDRPICSRCLTCGTECNYSPSSRSGKPKSDGQPHVRPQPTIPTTVNMFPDEQREAFGYAPQQLRAYPDNRPESDLQFEPGFSYKKEPGFAGFQVKAEAQWDSSSNINDGNMSRIPSMGSTVGFHGGSCGMEDPGSVSTPMEWSTEMDPIFPNTAFSCDPSADISGLLSPAVITGAAWSSNSDQSMMQNMASCNQGNPTPAATPLPFGTDSTSNYPQYAPNPSFFPTASTQKPYNSMPKRRVQCSCFAKCMSSLKALHWLGSQERPTLEQILHVNRGSLDACVQITICSQCMGLSVKHTAMLLATIISQIVAFYLSILHNTPLPNFLRDSDVMVSIGERHFQFSSSQVKSSALELVATEIQKLVDVYTRFMDTCGRVFEQDPCWAMISCLSENASSALENMNRPRKDARNMPYH
jgi:hypothetical protein